MPDKKVMEFVDKLAVVAIFWLGIFTVLGIVAFTRVALYWWK